MIKGPHLFTSESVTEGHPDKVADQISDSILDYVMSQDPMGRVACETLVTTGLALVAGEITTKCVIDYASIVRKTVESIGYTDANFGFDFKTCAVMSSVDTQSPDIAMGVDTGGAGDQGLMFGYATNESPELMLRKRCLSRISPTIPEIPFSTARWSPLLSLHWKVQGSSRLLTADSYPT